MNTTKLEKTAKIELIKKTWEYLNDNFHKFSEENKIRISLALVVKLLPTQINGNFTVTKMGEIIKENRIQDFLVGESPVIKEESINVDN